MGQNRPYDRNVMAHRWGIVKHLITSSDSNATFNKIEGKRTKGVLDAMKALLEQHTTQDLVDLEQQFYTKHEYASILILPYQSPSSAIIASNRNE
jgi:hypothetical protein